MLYLYIYTNFNCISSREYYLGFKFIVKYMIPLTSESNVINCTYMHIFMDNYIYHFSPE